MGSDGWQPQTCLGLKNPTNLPSKKRGLRGVLYGWQPQTCLGLKETVIANPPKADVAIPNEFVGKVSPRPANTVARLPILLPKSHYSSK